MPIDFTKTRERLKDFNFHRLFVEELGWSQPSTKAQTEMKVNNAVFVRRQISHLAGAAVYEVTAESGAIPDAKTRATIHTEISAIHHENLLIFIDKERTQSLWYWVKREDGKKYPRDHFYIKGQPGDLFLGKLSGIVIELSEFDKDGNISVLEVAHRLRNALDVESITKKFYGQFQEQRVAFLELIKGIPDDLQRRWYASVLINRLMFIYFLQRKGFLDNCDLDYLQSKLALSRQNGKDLFYSDFLKLLFFEGFAKPEDQRSSKARAVLGRISYLNGGLFLPHKIEQENINIRIPDEAFNNLFSLFQRYSWNLNDTPGGQDNEINPDILGYIFEKYINQKAFGAYYTRPEITEYLSERTVHRLILDAINTSDEAKHFFKGVVHRDFHDIADLLMNLDANMCRTLLFSILPKLSLLDPACGSGAFLVAAMKALIYVYSAVIGKIRFLADNNLTKWLANIDLDHKSISYFIKKTIIIDNLYGVDIMEEGAEIARLRLFLALVASAETTDQLEPLPNIDFNILQGNSLVGLMRVNDADFEQHTTQGHFFQRSYGEILAEKNRLIDVYRHTSTYAKDLTGLRNDIQQKKEDALTTLNDILLSEFKRLDIRYEQASWDQKTAAEGRPQRRNLNAADIERLQPFHWGYEFDKVLNERGGFDAIITNPPWEVFQTNEKEFFQRYASTIKKKSLRIEDWETQRSKLMKDRELREDWLDYASMFPHQWNWFKHANQYKNQISHLGGRAVGSKPNLYSLFTEQCFNLLREGGLAGIVIPSGIYTDLGTKQLREMLFSETVITGLFCFENRKMIFENVHGAFKFVVLTFQRGMSTKQFPAAFMRHEVEELQSFPQRGAIEVSVELVRKLSPDSLSIPEFKSKDDLAIASKLQMFPFFGAPGASGWSIELYGEELNMTRSAKYFKTSKTRYPLYEGGMIWHFDNTYDKARYWVSEPELRASFLTKRAKRIGLNSIPGDLKPDYSTYRIAIRKIASNTNERTLITTVIPPNTFAGNSLTVHFPFRNVPDLYNELVFSYTELLFLVGVMNSFVVDYVLRSRMTTNLNLFYLYQLPIPRPDPTNSTFKALVARVAKLVCVSADFDFLAREVGLRGSEDGVTDRLERSRLQSEIDGLVGHLYGLSEEEFSYTLSTFPLVENAIKESALAAYKLLVPKSADQQVISLIAEGESATLEFKSSARWDLKQNQASKVMERVIVKAAAGFLNVDSGGTLLVGVDDDGRVVGLQNDYKTLGKKPNRDGFANWLTTLFLGEFGKDASPLIRVTFHDIEGADVCQVQFKPSPRPIFIKDENGEHLFIRAGNSTRQLTTREAVQYCKQRWP